MSSQTNPKCFISIRWLKHLAGSRFTIPSCAEVPSAGCSQLHLHGLQARLCRSRQRARHQLRELLRSCCTPEVFWAPQGWLQGQDNCGPRRKMAINTFVWLGLRLMIASKPLAAPTEVISLYLGQAKSGILSPPSP